MDQSACPIPGCAQLCDGARVLCPGHWLLVAPALRQRVTAAYRRFQAAHARHQSLSMGPVREARSAWIMARNEAVTEVVRQLREAGVGAGDLTAKGAK